MGHKSKKTNPERVPASGLLQTHNALRTGTSLAKAKAGPGGMSKLEKQRVINTDVVKEAQLPPVPSIEGRRRKNQSETAEFTESTKPEVCFINILLVTAPV